MGKNKGKGGGGGDQVGEGQPGGTGGPAKEGGDDKSEDKKARKLPLTTIHMLRRLVQKQEAEEKARIEKQINDKTIKLVSLGSLASAMAHLGKVQEDLVNLTQEQERYKATIAVHEQEKVRAIECALTCSCQKGAQNKLKNELEKEKKKVAELEVKLAFSKMYLAAHPRVAHKHPALMVPLIKRILEKGQFGKQKLSDLSTINKPWREACQSILFARFVDLRIDHRAHCESIYTLFKQSGSLGDIVHSLSLSFHAPVYGGGTPREHVPVTLIPLIAACKKAKVMHFRALATMAATRHVLTPVRAQLEEISIDCEDHARFAPKVIDWDASPPHGLFADWKQLKTVSLRKLQIEIYGQQPSLCRLVQLRMATCQVSGSLIYMLASSTESLRDLWLVGCAGIGFQEVLEILEVLGPRLLNLKLLGNRFGDAGQTEHSFDQPLAGCVALTDLSLDLALPINSPDVLLAHQPHLKTVELCRQEHSAFDFDMWRKLFGVVSKRLKTVNIIGAPWMHHEALLLKDEWRWLGAESHFVTARPRYR